MSDTCQEQDETVRLVRASQGGDRVAFDRLVQLHQDQAMRVAFGVLGNVHDAAEVVQEAFLKGYLRIKSLAAAESFRFWILRIVVNEAVSRHRALRRRAAMMRAFAAVDSRRRSPELDEKGNAEDLQAAVERALLRLTASQAKAIALFGIEDLPHAEVARIMGCSATVTRWHVHRARQKLRLLLREYLE
ncbi:MAG: RNA polymerase sigma factor [Phycisphaerales bacterium]